MTDIGSNGPNIIHPLIVPVSAGQQPIDCFPCADVRNDGFRKELLSVCCLDTRDNSVFHDQRRDFDARPRFTSVVRDCGQKVLANRARPADGIVSASSQIRVHHARVNRKTCGRWSTTEVAPLGHQNFGKFRIARDFIYDFRGRAFAESAELLASSPLHRRGKDGRHGTHLPDSA